MAGRGARRTRGPAVAFRTSNESVSTWSRAPTDCLPPMWRRHRAVVTTEEVQNAGRKSSGAHAGAGNHRNPRWQRRLRRRRRVPLLLVAAWVKAAMTTRARVRRAPRRADPPDRLAHRLRSGRAAWVPAPAVAIRRAPATRATSTPRAGPAARHARIARRSARPARAASALAEDQAGPRAAAARRGDARAGLDPRAAARAREAYRITARRTQASAAARVAGPPAAAADRGLAAGRAIVPPTRAAQTPGKGGQTTRRRLGRRPGVGGPLGSSS